MFRRILICDDQKLSSSILKQMIYRNGEYIIVEVEDLIDAQKTLTKNKEDGKEFDFIIVSVTFNKDDLFDFLEDVASKEYETEIALSGAAGLEDDIINKALSLKMGKFLTKPYKETEVKNFL
jgi:CheY-like chemotaxis protein